MFHDLYWIIWIVNNGWLNGSPPLKSKIGVVLYWASVYKLLAWAGRLGPQFAGRHLLCSQAKLSTNIALLRIFTKYYSYIIIICGCVGVWVAPLFMISFLHHPKYLLLVPLTCPLSLSNIIISTAPYNITRAFQSTALSLSLELTKCCCIALHLLNSSVKEKKPIYLLYLKRINAN